MNSAPTSMQTELFPLVDGDGLTKPTVQIIAEEAVAAGIEEICIVAPRAARRLMAATSAASQPPALLLLYLGRRHHGRQWR